MVSLEEEKKYGVDNTRNEDVALTSTEDKKLGKQSNSLKI